MYCFPFHAEHLPEWKHIGIWMTDTVFTQALEEPTIFAVDDCPVAHVVVSRAVQNADTSRADGGIMYAD